MPRARSTPPASAPSCSRSTTDTSRQPSNPRAHPRFRGKTKLGSYGGFIVQTDGVVGRVLKALDESGIADNTVVFYTSDNGSFMHSYPDKPDHVDDEKVQAYRPENHRANGPLRGTKADVWEAGHRVPFFARWPGKAKAGSKCDVTITHTDIFATCAAIAGAKLPEDAADLGETENVANKYPEIVKRLTARCEELREAGRSR